MIYSPENSNPQACRNAENVRYERPMAVIGEGISIPEPDTIDDHSGQFKLRLPRSLHRQPALESKGEGAQYGPVSRLPSQPEQCVSCLIVSDASAQTPA